MRLILTGDLHGFLPPIPSCDLLIIAGDICPIECHELDFQAQWLEYGFIPWLQEIPAEQTIFIAGNHDFVFAQSPESLIDLEWPAIYLQDSGCQWEGLNIWGTPWANELPGWPFTAPEDELEKYWQQIPSETEILIVHGPPFGYGDQVVGNLTGDALNVGSRTLLERLNVLPNLRLVVFGHIHEGAGVYQLRETTLINASLMSVEYKPIQPLRQIDL